MSERFRAFVARHVERRAPLEREAHAAAWQLALTADEKWEREAARLETSVRRLLSDPEAFAELRSIRDAGEVTSADERRQLEILLLEHERNQTSRETLEELVELEVKAEALYARFRPRLDGDAVTENRIRDVLRDSEDVEHRRRAWESSKTIGPEVAPLILAMAEKRNDAARRLGYRDHFAMDLALQEVDETYLFDVLDRLETLTREPYEELMAELRGRLADRFGVEKADVRPWHLGDPFFQEAVPPDELSLSKYYESADLVDLSRRFFTNIGFDVSDVLERSDLFPRERKNQGAFCTHIDRATEDIRVCCNIVPGEYWMDTMLHELGHAVYDQGLGGDLPWLLRGPAHILSTEAIALLFGRLATDPDWMARFLGLSPAEADSLRGNLREVSRMKQLVFPRWVMVMTNFERALYADPAQDLDTLWWDLVERFQKITRPEGRHAPDWACKAHFALAPVYYHNYLLGDLMASQLHSWLERELQDRVYFDRKDTGALLRDRLFREGARRPWDEALQHATGEPLDPRHYVEQFVTVSS